jgi:ligand-binding sensor domain-containing protein
LPFGLLTRGVGTIAADGEELWFGGDERGPRRGVTRADHSLQRWGHFEAQDGAPAGYVADVLPATGAVWFAASDGLYRHDRRSGRWRRLGESDGLPTAEATALAPAPTGLWVGTRRGVVALDDAGEVAEGPLLTGQTVYRLVASRDSLWIATDVGLWVLPAGAQAPVPAPGVENHPALRGPVIDVRPAFGSLFALTERGLYRFDGQSWRGPIAEAGQAGLGRLRALAAGDGQLWVGGDRGLARWDTETQLWTYYWVPADIPEGPVRRVLPAGEHVWLSTPAGALRLAWRR